MTDLTPQQKMLGNRGDFNLENEVSEFLQLCRNQKLAHITRYGTIAQVVGMASDGSTKCKLNRSLPDFGGTIKGQGGVEVVFDCKVVGDKQASMDMSKVQMDKQYKGSQARQLQFMVERSEYGAGCFFLIHFNVKPYAKAADRPAQTWAFPVQLTDASGNFDHPYWSLFWSGEKKRIHVSDCEQHAVRVEWFLPSERSTKPRPNVLKAAREVLRRNPNTLFRELEQLQRLNDEQYARIKELEAMKV